MKYRHHLMAFIAAFTLSVDLMAKEKEIYKSKDVQGGLEFTDQPSPGSEVVGIQKPNIADAVESQKPAQAKPEPKQTKKPITPAQPKTSTRRDWDDDDRNPKQVRRDQKKQERRNDRRESRESPRKSAGSPAPRNR